MLALLGDGSGGLAKAAEKPQVVLMLGLQGSGKTTTSAKLGRWLVEQDAPATGFYRRSTTGRDRAAERVVRPGWSAVHDPAGDEDPTHRAVTAVGSAKELGFDTVIVDTAGRVHLNDALMSELEAIKGAVAPSDLLYVADAMTGQDAIKSAGRSTGGLGLRVSF